MNIFSQFFFGFPLFKPRHMTSQDDSDHLRSLLQKWFSHEYSCTIKTHKSPFELQENLRKFFRHYENHKDYSITSVPQFVSQLYELESFIFSKLWCIEECTFYYLGLVTSFSESKFALRLNFLPKHIFFKNS